jgi:uncharacterized membrane protein YgcG
MAPQDLSTLADAITFALLTTVAGAIGWAVFRVAARRYGVRRTASTVSVAAVAIVAVGALAMWPVARSGVEAITGGQIPEGSAPEPQRTEEPGMPAPEAVEPAGSGNASVEERTKRTDDDRALDEEPTEDPAGGGATGGGSGGSGGGSGGSGGPGNPGTDPDPSPSQTPSPDPTTTPSPTTPPSPSPSPSQSPDDNDDDDGQLGGLVDLLGSLLQGP